jgi:Glyoxalase-like domain
MHRSQLGGFIIDCQTDDLKAAAEFWAAALGLRIRPSTDPEDTGYVRFDTAANDLDIEAEVRRLEKLGAKRLKQIHSWWVMEAPSGHRFCVVSAQRARFATEANVWK